MRLNLDIETDSKVVHGLKLENVGPAVSGSNVIPVKFSKTISMVYSSSGEFFWDIFFVTKGVFYVCLKALSNDFSSELM